MGDEVQAAGTPRLFERTCLVSAGDVCLSARCALGQRQLIALVMRSGDLTLYYQRGQSGQLPVMKHVPWFVDSNKKIAALCFNPPGNWLVVVAYDGSIFIVPALSLVDSSAVLDHRWSTSDITSFPSPLVGGSRRGRPTAVAWWQNIQEYHHVVILGTDAGELSFFSLTSGMQVGTTHVGGPVEALHICEDNSLDSVFLLITSRQRSQWKLLLEQSATNYCWPLEGSSAPKQVPAALESSSSSHNSADGEVVKNSNSPHLPTARSRLQGLKQLSVEKLAHLKLKLAETRLRNTNNFHVQREAGFENGDEALHGEAVEPQQHVSSSGPLPERVSNHVGDTFLCPQYARDRYLLSGYYAPSSILTIHSINMDVVPLFVYKLPPDCRDILVTDRFLFVTSSGEQSLSVVSCHFAESRLDCDIDYNVDSVVGTFEFNDSERVLALYKQGSATHPRQNYTRNLIKEGLGDVRPRGHKKSSTQFVLPKDASEVKVDSPPVDSCIVVTTQGIYQVALRQPAAQVFMELVVSHQQLETAERIALMFGLPLKELLEHAGDMKLAAKDFPRAIALYKLSRCSHLKSVLKFAAGGHSAELLGFITLLFSTAGLDLTTAERIHLSNLAVMSHTEQLLRATVSKATPFKHFLKFLQNNLFYDEVLAVNVAGQTGLWEVLQFLASHRGLHQEVLDIVSTILSTLIDGLGKPPTKGTSRLAPLLDTGLWMCVSDPTLLPALLAKPQHCKIHLQFVTTCLPHLEQFALQRLAALYDPSSPLLQLGLQRMLRAPRAHQCSSSYSYFSDSVAADAPSAPDEGGVPLEDMVQKFLLVLLYLTRKMVNAHVFIPQLMSNVQPPDHDVQDLDDLSPTPLRVQATPLSAGFGHVALIRNSTVHTWGNATQGCLGTGPTLSQYGCAQPITFFPSLKLEVVSVSCGRLHSIALTDNGVFTWGSSQYGQLGVGKTGRSSHPRLVEGLCRERVAAVSAGQYHSLALTGDGRVYSWGWGVHGQLGHGSVEDLHSPALVRALSGKVVVQVRGGYAHSLALTADGRVFSFGSSMFGQLGHGTTAKSSVPVHVATLPESIRTVATGYFHNLAVSTSNKLYVWGSSPQVLRVQAQAQKKARLLHHQPFMLLNGPDLTGLKSPLRQVPIPRPRLGADDEAPAKGPWPNNFSSAINYSDSDFEVIGDAPAGNPAPSENGHDSLLASKKTVKAVIESNVPGADEVVLSSLGASGERDVFRDSGNMFGASKVLADVIPSQDVQLSEDGCIEVSFQAGRRSGHGGEKTGRPPGNTLSNGDVSEAPVVRCTPQRISGGNGLPRLSELEVMKAPDARTNLHLKAMLSGIVSAEDYVMQSVVSPTMEFKGLTAATDTNSGSNHIKTGNGSVLQGQPDGPEDGQSHLLPQLVDTSLVIGEILQVSCGCHHSALLSDEGVLYTWGRNLDGQVGNGTRKEVQLPTPLSSALARCPPPTTRSGGGAKANISGVIPSGSDRMLVREVCCGCEFTVALDNTSKVWAWGSNASGQLGKPPNEESRVLEGKLFMLKTAKRVIKLPHGSSNSSDTPKEVLGIPSSTISFKYGVFPNHNQGPEYGDVCPPLSTMEKPSYGPVTLHYVMQQFHGFYDSNYILSKCVELENYQTAAKLAALDRNYPVALSYQLKALALAIPESILQSDQKSAEEQHPARENYNKVQLVDNRIFQNGKKNCAPVPVVKNSSSEISRVWSAKENEKIIEIESVESKIPNTHSDPTLNSGEKFEDLEKSSREAERVSTGGAAPNSSPKCVDGLESSKSLESSGKVKLEGSGGGEVKVVGCSADGSQDEIHTFAVEGGKEQLFEVGQCLSSPDSASSLVNTPMSTTDAGSAVPPGTDPQCTDNKASDKLSSNKPGRVPSDLQQHNSKSSRLSLTLDLQKAVDVANKVENYRSSASPCRDALNHGQIVKRPCLNPFPSNSVPCSASTPRTSADDVSLPTFTTFSSGAVSPLGSDHFPGQTQEPDTSAQFVVTNYKDLMLQASVIVEYYVSVMEEDSHAMMNKLLHKGIEFWLQHSLQMDVLENLLLKHMSKFFYPLGLLMFCQRPGCTDEEGGSRTAAVLASLSSRFSIQLCSILLSHLQQRKQCPEYVEVLARCSAGGSEPTEDKSQEQMMEEVFQNLGVYSRPGELAAQPCIRFKDVSVLKQGGGEAVEQLFVFSCGHHHTAESLRQELDAGLRSLRQPLPNTARMLKEVFSAESPSLHLACPSCVLAYLRQQATPP